MESGGEGTGTVPASKPAAGARPAAGLYIVATPIGNLADVTLRALELLAAADVIACEDRRVTAKLLGAHGIRTPTMSYHEHNAERVRPHVIERLKRGETVALVSDAGTPLVSDPGYKLVRAALAAGVPVGVAPGPSAATAALVVSGLPTDRFLFAGFLPTRAAARRAALVELSPIRATLVLFEAARRLPAALDDMAAVFGAREACVARELTKLYEETRRGSLTALAAHYRDAGAPKGEVAVVVAGAAGAAPAMPEEAVDARLVEALATMRVRDAAAAVAAETGLPRRQLYARALALALGRRAPKPRR